MKVRNLETHKRSSLPLFASQQEKLVFLGGQGFTLIEMMVVIGLIAIVVCGAVPGLRKLYRDFKINETLDQISTALSSFRDYYLIKSEFPGDADPNYVIARQAWCLPSSYYTRTPEGSTYQLNLHPYQAEAYDINNWISVNSLNQFYLSVYNSSKNEEWYARLQEKFPTYEVYPHISGNGKPSLCLSVLPGLGQFTTEGSALSNRFY